MTINWKQKLTSRKFWMAVVGFITPLLLGFGVAEDSVTQVTTIIIAGADEQGKENVVIVELKQWQKAEVVDDDMQYSVRTYVADARRIVPHPSYQALREYLKRCIKN